LSTSPLKKGDKIFVAGHRGLLGSAILRKIVKDGEFQPIVRTRSELDLTDQLGVREFMKTEQPDAIILAAAKVGGVNANNTYPADFIGLNLAVQQNVIWEAFNAGVRNFLFLGSSCVYPREASQPIDESALLTGLLEPTNAPYAVAKIAGISMCNSIRRQYGLNYFTAMPPNVYGAYDNFDLKTSHVLPALIRKVHEALPDKPVEVWGTGKPRREFMYSDEVADALLFLLGIGGIEGHVNVGTGISISIAELAQLIQSVTGHTGEIYYNTAMPDGFPEKTMNIHRLHELGWRHKIELRDGIKLAYDWYLSSLKD
jgi:GDP-L-fucose synthase